MKREKMIPGIRYVIRGFDKDGEPNWEAYDDGQDPVTHVGHFFQVGNIKRAEDKKNKKIHKQVSSELERGRKRIEGARPVKERGRSLIRSDRERKSQG